MVLSTTIKSEKLASFWKSINLNISSRYIKLPNDWNKSIGMSKIVHYTVRIRCLIFTLHWKHSKRWIQNARLHFRLTVFLNHWCMDYRRNVGAKFFRLSFQKVHGTLNDRLRIVCNLSIDQLSKARNSDATMCSNVMNTFWCERIRNIQMKRETNGQV